MDYFSENIEQDGIWHGDVILYPVKEKPGGKMLEPGEKGYILAEGEITGHTHRIEETEKVILFRYHNILFMEVNEPAHLVHEEHGIILLEKGIYKIGRVKEFDALSSIERFIQD